VSAQYPAKSATPSGASSAHPSRAHTAGRAARTQPIDEGSLVSAEGSAFDHASRNEAAALVTAVLAELDEDKRELLVLVDLEQVPVPEVAAYLEVPLNTAYSRVRLARRAFEAALANRGGRR